MKRFVVLVLTAAVLLGGAAGAVAQCQLPGFNALPANPPTPIYLGPLMAYYATNYPDVANAIIGGRDAWNAAADTAGRFGGYGGQTNSDCPLGQAGPQIGAYGFTSGGCATAQAYGYNIPPHRARGSISLSSITFLGNAPGVERNRCRSISTGWPGRRPQQPTNTIFRASSLTSSGTCLDFRTSGTPMLPASTTAPKTWDQAVLRTASIGTPCNQTRRPVSGRRAGATSLRSI